MVDTTWTTAISGEVVASRSLVTSWDHDHGRPYAVDRQHSLGRRHAAS